MVYIGGEKMKKDKNLLINLFKKAALPLALVLGVSGTLPKTVVEAHDSPRIGPYYLAGGVSKVNYYISSSAKGYESLIDKAANKWVVTGHGYNPIYMYKTTNSNASHMDIYGGEKNSFLQSIGANAVTFFWDLRNGQHVSVDPVYSFWDYGVIYLNTIMLPKYTANVRQGVIGHEMGHVFGLDEHNHDPNSIMCQMGSGRAVYTPGKVDHNGINNIYK